MLVMLLSSLVVISHPTQAEEQESQAWDPYSQPWAQYGRDPGHSRLLPPHGDTGLTPMQTPAINWVAFDSGEGADGYGVAVADFSSSITAPEGAKERCGMGHLFAVLTHTENVDERHLAIIEGDTSKVAWEVNLGSVDIIRSTPIIVDVDGDSRQEIAIVYDSDSSLEVDLWSPDITCDESGWTVSGHSNEKLWSWSDSELRIGIPNAHPYTGPESVTQPLLADLELDGTPELIIAAVDTTTDEPTVVSLPLGLQTPEENWKVALDRGSHPSDPAFAALDDNSGSIVLTTVDELNGNFWIWQIDGPTGSLDWERVSIQGTDDDDDTPRIRLPGPVITQLDSDAAPEMIITLPSDENLADDGMGAQFIGMELTSTDEIWRFRAKNGYADAEPIAVDTTGDGITDRVCWVTWYSTGFGTTDRDGLTGCHDITIDPPFREWSRVLQSGSGNDNEGEVAISAPIVIDLDGEDEPDLLVAYGERLFAFDGNTGTSADLGVGWSSPIDLPHRTWASPAIADLDGDGYLDILIGDMLISEAMADIAPLPDGRGIGFTPADPDPGEMVTISGQYANIGIVDTDEPVDAVIMMNGVEIERHRVNVAQSIAPSGEGGPITFSVDIEATLGVHNVELILDVNNNLTQTRYDNDNYSTTLVVLDPYVAQIQTPAEVTRVLPGTSDSVDISVTSIGSRSASWTLSYNDSNLPEGWSFSPNDQADLNLNLERDTPQIVQFQFFVPQNALGSDSAYVPLTLTLDQDETITTSVTLPLEVERTRGLSLQGASGLPLGTGYGIPGDTAHVWMMVENVGNAQETTEMFWSSNSWGASMSIVDYSGNTQFGIDLDPNAKEEYLIEVNVPNSRSLGDSTSATLTLCIGSGENEICEDFNFDIYASGVKTEIPHIRTIPATGLTWDINHAYNGSKVVWDMSVAGMLKTGWSWNATGDLSINGTNLEMDGYNGQLTLDLPFDAVPSRHFFNQSADNLDNFNLTISLHVLQVFRASAEIVSPPDESVFNVSERTKLILKLENPGNGDDTFTLSGKVGLGNLTELPNVTFEINNPTRTLGPGTTSMVPVWITLPEDVPARERFELIFEWESVSDSNAISIADITIEARPDHRWDATIDQGQSISVTPGENLNLTISVTNIGNTDDLLTLSPSFSIEYSGQDNSVWTSDGINSSRLGVYESESLTLGLTIPGNTWAGTVADLTLVGSSSGFDIDYNISIELNVASVAGWRVNLSDTSLEVSPLGGELNLSIEQKGNSPARPYFAKAGQGWNVTLPNNGSIINPGESGSIIVNVTPPKDAIAGEVGVVTIRISNGNGAGQIVEQIPIRIGTEPGVSLGSKGSWKVNSNEHSWPTAWIENTGNDVAIIGIDIPNIPEGWDLTGDNVIVLAPKEISGLPLQIKAPATWNGNNLQLDILYTHQILGTMTYSITLNQSDTILVSSPVHTGRSGEKISVTTFNTETGYDTALIPLPESRTNISHNGMNLHLNGIQSPTHIAQCTSTHGQLSTLGIEALSTTWSSCLVTASDDYPLVANAILRTSDGQILDSSTIRLNQGVNTTVNLSTSNWDPNPGVTIVDVLIVDSNGVVLHSSSSTHISRQSGWNLEVDNIEITDTEVRIGINRVGSEIMQGSICFVLIENEDNDWDKQILFDATAFGWINTPTTTRPDNMEEGDLIRATISCDAPWDIDDNPEDDTLTKLAPSIPLVTYESSDIYWTLGIGFLLLVVAYFAGILKIGEGVSKKKTTGKKPKTSTSQITKEKFPEKEVVDVVAEEEINIDDLSFEIEDSTTEEIQESEDDSDESEEVIDIDDTTASGRLSALRREMSSDDKPKKDTKEDLARRMDSFLKDR